MTMIDLIFGISGFQPLLLLCKMHSKLFYLFLIHVKPFSELVLLIAVKQFRIALKET